MNIYRYQFGAICPNNGDLIVYQLEISTAAVIYVEHIKTHAALTKIAYHEELADNLYAQFGGRQIMTAHHHGVDIETRRGFE